MQTIDMINSIVNLTQLSELRQKYPKKHKIWDKDVKDLMKRELDYVQFKFDSEYVAFLTKQRAPDQVTEALLEEERILKTKINAINGEKKRRKTDAYIMTNMEADDARLMMQEIRHLSDKLQTLQEDGRMVDLEIDKVYLRDANADSSKFAELMKKYEEDDEKAQLRYKRQRRTNFKFGRELDAIIKTALRDCDDENGARERLNEKREQIRDGIQRLLEQIADEGSETKARFTEMKFLIMCIKSPEDQARLADIIRWRGDIYPVPLHGVQVAPCLFG